MRIGRAGWVQQNGAWPYLPSACGLPFVPEGVGPISAWFNSGWQPQAQLGDGKTRKAAQPSPNPSDLRLPHRMDPQIMLPGIWLI